jgi:hypothetical protein
MVLSRTKAGSRHASIRLAGMIRASAVGLDERPTARARVDDLATIFEFLDRRMPDLLLERDAERTRNPSSVSSKSPVSIETTTPLTQREI